MTRTCLFSNTTRYLSASVRVGSANVGAAVTAVALAHAVTATVVATSKAAERNRREIALRVGGAMALS
jgi:hypothetical protein